MSEHHPTTSSQLPSEREALYEELRAAAGNTALVEQPKLPRVWTKLEYQNPSGSHYDRVYPETLQQLEQAGCIDPETTTLYDVSSGSAGASLAYYASKLGYRAHLFVPNELPEARVRPAIEAGATVERCGPGYINHTAEVQRSRIISRLKDPAWHLIRPGRHPALQQLKSFVFEDPAGKRECHLNHSENPLTPLSFGEIGREIAAQLHDTPPEAALLAIGNGTSTLGIGNALRETWPAIKLIGYTSPPGERVENFGLTGPGTDTVARYLSHLPPALELMDEVHTVSTLERERMRHINSGLPPEQQLGRSSLMALAIAAQLDRSGPVLTIGYDTMSRY